MKDIRRIRDLFDEVSGGRPLNNVKFQDVIMILERFIESTPPSNDRLPLGGTLKTQKALIIDPDDYEEARKAFFREVEFLFKVPRNGLQWDPKISTVLDLAWRKTMQPGGFR